MTETIQPINYSVDLLRAVLWQYDDATNLQAILRARQAWYIENQQEFWQNWETDVFDLRTANSFGLAVWSIILGLPIFINAPSGSVESWGFGQYHANFNRGNFGIGSNPTVQLSVEDARILLRLRAYQIQSAGCVPEINRELADIFGGSSSILGVPAAFVIDNHDMTCTYIFNFLLPSELLFVLRYFDVLPRPAGVQSTIVVEFSGTLVTEDRASDYVTEAGAEEDYAAEDGVTLYTTEDSAEIYSTEETGGTNNYVTDPITVGDI